MSFNGEDAAERFSTYATSAAAEVDANEARASAFTIIEHVKTTKATHQCE